MGRSDRQLRLLVSVAVLGLVLAACSPFLSDELPEGVVDRLPCDPPAQNVELGSPSKEAPPATFSVDGRPVWATIGRGGGGGFFPDVDLAALIIGHQERPPSYDPPSGRIENEEMRVTVYVGRFTELDLAAEDYWGLLSQGGELALFSCEPDVISNADSSR